MKRFLYTADKLRLSDKAIGRLQSAVNEKPFRINPLQYLKASIALHNHRTVWFAQSHKLFHGVQDAYGKVIKLPMVEGSYNAR